MTQSFQLLVLDEVQKFKCLQQSITRKCEMPITKRAMPGSISEMAGNRTGALLSRKNKGRTPLFICCNARYRCTHITCSFAEISLQLANGIRQVDDLLL